MRVAWLPMGALVVLALAELCRLAVRCGLLGELLVAEQAWLAQPSTELMVAEMVLSLVVSLLFSVAVCSWLLWEALAYRRITQLPGASWSSSPWGVIGWWFVPMAHLVRPRRLVEELYRNALPELERPSDERARVVQIWWALWLLSQALWLVALVLTEQPHTMEWNALADVLVSLSFTGAAIAAVLVVYSVDRRIARL